MIITLKNYVITQKYGETITDPQGHTGIDLYQPIGTPVYAVEGGDILASGIINNKYGNQLYGNCVLIDHKNGYYSFYAHLSKVNFKTGMSVIKGAIIGTVGATGNVTGPHLHFEIRTNPIWNRKNFIDPESVIQFEHNQYEPVVIDNNKLPEMEKDDFAIVNNPILNLRNKAGYNGKQLGQLYQNTVVKITGSAIEQDGLKWYPVQIEGFLASSEGDTVLLKKMNRS